MTQSVSHGINTMYCVRARVLTLWLCPFYLFVEYVQVQCRTFVSV